MKVYNKGGKILYSNGEPLTAYSDNVLISRIGIACKEAAKAPAGDSIDTGLVLRRLLDGAGLDIVERR